MEHGDVKEHEENVEGRRMISLNWQHLSCFHLWLSLLNCHCWSDWKRKSCGFWDFIMSKAVFLLHCQHNLLLKPPKTTVFTLIKRVLKHGIWVVPIGVQEGNGDLARCHYLYVREEGNNCYTAVACNDHYSRKESHKGVKPCYSFTLFQICWNESKQRKSPLWFLIFSSWVFICDCLNWNVWCQKAAGSQSLFTHEEHFRL